MPARKKSGAYHHGNLKEALADAAVVLLDEVGPSFTVRQVAKLVGVTHGAAYRHFEDRDALLAEVARRGFESLARSVAASIARVHDPRAKLEALIVAYMRFGWKHTAHYDVMFGERLNESGRFPELENAVQKALRILQSLVAAFLCTNDAKTTRNFGIAVWSFAHGYTSILLRRRIQVRSLRAAEDHIRQLAQPLLDGARPTVMSTKPP